MFFYDGDSLVEELDTSGTPNILRRYIPGNSVDDTLVWYEGGGLSTPNWLHADEQGTVIATTNGSGVATQYVYSVTGEPTNWSGARFRYTGQAALPEVQLYYYKARMYDPHLGRFLQTDPIGYLSDYNLYAYVGNDPINRVDPTGLAFEAEFGCLTRFAHCGGGGSSGGTSANPEEEVQKQLKKEEGTNGGNVQVAQAAMGLCVLGPGGCAVGAGITAGQVILGGAVVVGGAAIILHNQQGDDTADRPPPGSKPIDSTPWSGDHQEIKGSIGAGPADSVRISPAGDVWGQNPDGSWTNHGPASDYTGSGKPSGQRGKDRDGN